MFIWCNLYVKVVIIAMAVTYVKIVILVGESIRFQVWMEICDRSGLTKMTIGNVDTKYNEHYKHILNKFIPFKST